MIRESQTFTFFLKLILMSWYKGYVWKKSVYAWWTEVHETLMDFQYMVKYIWVPQHKMYLTVTKYTKVDGVVVWALLTVFQFTKRVLIMAFYNFTGFGNQWIKGYGVPYCQWDWLVCICSLCVKLFYTLIDQVCDEFSLWKWSPWNSFCLFDGVHLVLLYPGFD